MFTEYAVSRHWLESAVLQMSLILDLADTAPDILKWLHSVHCSFQISLVDYRKRQAEQTPININGAIVDIVSSSLVHTSPTNYHGPNTPRQS